MEKILGLVDAVSVRTGKAVSVLSLLTAFAIVYEIVMRQVFVLPTVWASEGTVFMCAALYMLGGAWTLLEDKHVRVDMIHSRLGPRGKAVIDICTFPFFLLYVAVMIWATWPYMTESIALRETTMTPWNPPLWPMKIVMFVSLVLIALQGTAKFLRDLRTAFGGRAGA